MEKENEHGDDEEKIVMKKKNPNEGNSYLIRCNFELTEFLRIEAGLQRIVFNPLLLFD